MAKKITLADAQQMVNGVMLNGAVNRATDDELSKAHWLLAWNEDFGGAAAIIHEMDRRLSARQRLLAANPFILQGA